ncbi:MAG: hypothetical protein ACR2P7_08730 [bacterium]
MYNAPSGSGDATLAAGAIVTVTVTAVVIAVVTVTIIATVTATATTVFARIVPDTRPSGSLALAKKHSGRFFAQSLSGNLFSLFQHCRSV